MNTVNIREFVRDKGNYPVWHPYSTNNDEYMDRLNIVSGKGIYLKDSNGKEYIDAASGLWNVSLGYGNKRIQDAIYDQINKLSYCSLFQFTNSTVVKAANKLLDITGKPMDKVIFGCSGSESVECAMKLMRSYWYNRGNSCKKMILSFSDSYHGTYYGAISVSGLEQFYQDEIGPIVPEIQLLTPKFEQSCGNKCWSCQIECLNETLKFIDANTSKIAGIIIEPILASKGVLIPCRKYIKGLVEFCQNNNVLVTFDEVAVGFFRTGQSFYYKKIGVIPDILCLSKGINSGYLPLGATVVSEKITKTFKEGTFILQHGSTQGGNPAACAALIAAMEEYSDLQEGLEEKADRFYDELLENIAHINIVGEVRHEGLLFGIDITINGVNVSINDLMIISRELVKRGLLVYVSEIGISLFPMCITTYDEWHRIVNILKSVLMELANG